MLTMSIFALQKIQGIGITSEKNPFQRGTLLVFHLCEFVNSRAGVREKSWTYNRLMYVIGFPAMTPFLNMTDSGGVTDDGSLNKSSNESAAHPTYL